MIRNCPLFFQIDRFARGGGGITAIATDSQNISTTSAAITLTVTTSVTQIYYIHTDQLNTPRLITDSNNAKVWEWHNDDPFANNVPNDDPNSTGSHFEYNPRLSGQYYDKETGLFYNWNRFYNPATGRYDQSDLIGLAAGVNTYGYVGGNPLSYSDPMGLAKLTGIPSNFSDAVQWRKKYRKLIDADRIMRERLKAYCGKDKKRLQKIFDDWEIYIDPNIDDVKHRSRRNWATTEFESKSTQFNQAFFGSGASDPSPSFTFTHEFRHLMKENDDLYSPAGLADSISGHSERVSYEIDADNFARNFPNECTCGD